MFRDMDHKVSVWCIFEQEIIITVIMISGDRHSSVWTDYKLIITFISTKL